MPRNRTNPLAPAIERLLVLTKLPRMEELADRFGFPIETVRSWNKRGDVSKPGLRRIAEVLGVPLGNLQEQLVGEVHLSIADLEDAGAPMHLESRPASYTLASRGRARRHGRPPPDMSHLEPYRPPVVKTVELFARSLLEVGEKDEASGVLERAAQLGLPVATLRRVRIAAGRRRENQS